MQRQDQSLACLPSLKHGAGCNTSSPKYHPAVHGQAGKLTASSMPSLPHAGTWRDRPGPKTLPGRAQAGCWSPAPPRGAPARPHHCPSHASAMSAGSAPAGRLRRGPLSSPRPARWRPPYLCFCRSRLSGCLSLGEPRVPAQVSSPRSTCKPATRRQLGTGKAAAARLHAGLESEATVQCCPSAKAVTQHKPAIKGSKAAAGSLKTPEASSHARRGAPAPPAPQRSEPGPQRSCRSRS